MTDDLPAFIRERLAEDELWAIEASRDRDRFTPTGAHWQWVCNAHDNVITPDPSRREHLEGECGCWTHSLRSIEHFPTRSGVGDLPQFIIRSDESTAAAAGHIARHDPARALAEVDAKRRIINDHLELGIEGECSRCVDWDEDPEGDLCATPHKHPCKTLRLLALPYADHPDYRDEWRP